MTLVSIHPVARTLLFSVLYYCCMLCVVVNGNVSDQGINQQQQQQLSIHNVTRDQLRSAVHQNNHVLLLCTDKRPHESSTTENQVQEWNEEIQKSLEIPVLKIEGSLDVAKEFGLAKLPSLLFFRKGKAIIYDESIVDGDLLDWLQTNWESSLRSLDDESFEHLTQASTGATTGDWFVLFCNLSTVACQSLQPSWESVAAQLKNKLNVAMVDVQFSPELIERFKISYTPVFKLFHHGKMYHYAMKKYDITTLMRFATGWYKNVKFDKVPVQKTPFDNLIDRIARRIKTELQDPYAVPSIVMLLLPFSIVCFAVMAFGRQYKIKDD